MKLNDQTGQTLIEALIALAAAVLVISAIAITGVTSLSNVEFTKNQNLATEYSREGIEIVRQISRNNWKIFTTYTGVNYCLDKGSNTLTAMGPTGCGQNVGTYVRQIIIEQASSSCSGNVKVTSSVSWSDSKCTVGNVFCHKVNIESCLADTNPIKAP